MVRAALIWLLAGFIIGALMLTDHLLAGNWRAWFAPTHGHMLFVGWFLQFAIGIAYWLLPRKRSDDLPLGYNERIALSGFILLNIGLGLRVIIEPVSRMGYSLAVEDAMLLLSAVAQVAAIGIIVSQLWSRLIPRPPKRGRSTGS